MVHTHTHTELCTGTRRGSTNVARLLKEGVERKVKKATGLLYSGCKTRFAFDQIVYTLSRGVNVFDYCNTLKMVATGGG